MIKRLASNSLYSLFELNGKYYIVYKPAMELVSAARVERGYEHENITATFIDEDLIAFGEEFFYDVREDQLHIGPIDDDFYIVRALEKMEKATYTEAGFHNFKNQFDALFKLWNYNYMRAVLQLTNEQIDVLKQAEYEQVIDVICSMDLSQRHKMWLAMIHANQAYEELNRTLYRCPEAYQEYTNEQIRQFVKMYEEATYIDAPACFFTFRVET